MSNGNWEIEPEIGHMISRVAQEHPNEAREATKDSAKLKKFFEKYNESEVVDILVKHPNKQEKVRKLVIEAVNKP
jgi:hypothetical protein